MTSTDKISMPRSRPFPSSPNHNALHHPIPYPHSSLNGKYDYLSIEATLSTHVEIASALKEQIQS